MTRIGIYLKEIKNKIHEETLKTEKLAVLLTDSEQYQINNEELLKYKKIQQGLKSIETVYEHIDNQAIAISEIETSINKQNNEIADYKKLLVNKIEFLSVTEQFAKLVVKSEKLIHDKLEQQQLLAVIKTKLSERKVNNASEKNKARALEVQLEIIQTHCKQYNVTKKVLKEIGSELNSANEAVTKVELDINTLMFEKQWFESILSSYSIDPKAKVYNQDLQYYITQRKNLFSPLAQLELDLEKQELAYIKSGSLNENLNRIIKWGEAYTIETETSGCPLCQSPFDSFDLLLSNIRKDKKDALALTEQEEQIADKRKSIAVIYGKIKNVETLIATIVAENISLLKSKLVDKQLARDVLDRDVAASKNRELMFEQQLSTIETYFGDKLGEDIVPNIDVYNKYKIQQEKLLQTANQLFTSSAEKIAEDESSVINKQTSLDTLDAEISIIPTEKKVLEMGTVYTVTKELLAKYEEEKLYESHNKLAEIIESKRLIQVKHESLLAGLLEQKESELVTLKTKPEYVEKEKLGSVIKVINKNIDERQVANIIFDGKYQKLTQSVKFDKQLITEAQDDNKALCEELINTLPKLEHFSIELKCILDDVKHNELKQALSVLENIEKELLENTLKKLAGVKDTCEEYIKDGVDKHFNKKTINAIYQRISPHPHYKEIDFKVSFSDTGKARLNITAKSKLNGGECVDPLLYMSSGQINVLSLSIFLAKTLHEKQGLATIFIDDPVQNLSDMNILSFVDLLRTLISAPHNKQIVISTHDESFFKLLKNKMPEKYYSTKYLQLSSFGLLA